MLIRRKQFWAFFMPLKAAHKYTHKRLHVYAHIEKHAEKKPDAPNSGIFIFAPLHEPFKSGQVPTGETHPLYLSGSLKNMF